MCPVLFRAGARPAVGFVLICARPNAARGLQAGLAAGSETALYDFHRGENNCEFVVQSREFTFEVLVGFLTIFLKLFLMNSAEF